MLCEISAAVQAHVVLKSAQLLEADEDEDAAAGAAVGAGGGAGITVSVVTGCMAVGGVVVGVGVTRVLSLEAKVLALRLTGTSDSGIFSA